VTARPFHAIPRTQAHTEDLEKELHWRAHHQPYPEAIHNILQVLVEDRLIKPKTLYYEALILSNCDAEHGSVDNVREILEQMEQEDLPMGAVIYLAVLKV